MKVAQVHIAMYTFQISSTISWWKRYYIVVELQGMKITLPIFPRGF